MAWNTPFVYKTTKITSAQLNAIIAEITSKLTEPTIDTDEYLKWNGSAWVGGTPAGSGAGGCFEFDSLGDAMPADAPIADSVFEVDSEGDVMPRIGA